MRLEAIDEPDEDLREAVYVQLRTHNQTSNPIWWEAREQAENDAKPLNLFAFDDDDCATAVAGLFATTQFAWLKIDIMAVVKAKRGSGIGSELLARAEEIARERGCKYSFTDTMDYQAPDFYRKCGYQIVGQIDDWDSHGHEKFFFKKDL